MNSFFFFYYSFFFSPHKSFSSKSKVLCLIIDERKNKHGKKKLRTLIWKHGVSRHCHCGIKEELRKKETIEFVEQKSWTFFLKPIGGNWCREWHLGEEKGREEKVEKISELGVTGLIFRIVEKILSFSSLFWCKYIFSSYILYFFHFGPYILFLPLLVPKPINAWHLGPFRHPTNSKSWLGWRWNKKII